MLSIKTRRLLRPSPTKYDSNQTSCTHSQHFIPKTAIHQSVSILRPQIDKTAAFLCEILSVNKQFKDIWSRGIFLKTSVGSHAFSFYWLISSTSNKPLVIGKGVTFQAFPNLRLTYPQSFAVRNSHLGVQRLCFCDRLQSQKISLSELIQVQHKPAQNIGISISSAIQ